MKCPKCHSKNTRVVSTDPEENRTKRYCKCLDCTARFTTVENYLKTAQNPGRVKNSFILNSRQCEMIKKNKYVLANYEWADIYNVSISTITNAKRKTEK
jgi:Zn finger protein HypA/HybF involved in hydrogenase expression